VSLCPIYDYVHNSRTDRSCRRRRAHGPCVLCGGVAVGACGTADAERDACSVRTTRTRYTPYRLHDSYRDQGQHMISYVYVIAYTVVSSVE
jgi:hypothetical protein